MYFLDTYAMVEYFRDNRKAAEVIEGSGICTSDFELMELYYISLRENGEETANRHFEAFARYRVTVPERTLKNAMKTRLDFQKRGKKISYVDAIGYQYAVENGMKFVTGDAEFRNVDREHVEYLGK